MLPLQSFNLLSIDDEVDFRRPTVTMLGGGVEKSAASATASNGSVFQYAYM